MVFNAAYSPDERHLATGQRFGLVRVWRRPAPNPEDRTVTLPHFAVRLKSSRDGRCVIPGKFGGMFFPGMSTPRLRVCATATGAALGPAFELGNECADAAVSGNGQTAAAVVLQGASGKLHVWDARTGRPAFDPLPLPGAPAAVAFDAADSRGGVLCDTGEVFLFDPQTGRARLTFRLEDWRPGLPQILTLAFVPRTESGDAGGAVVVMHADGSLRIHDETTGEPRCPPICAPQPSGRCGFFRIAPDGRRVAVAWAGPSHFVRLYDLSGAAISEPLPHPDVVFDICFSADGRRVFTGSRDGQARLWDWEAARLVCPPCTHPDEVFGVAITPDGHWGLTCCRKGKKDATGAIHFWEFNTGKPAAPPVRFDGSVHSIAVSPDGTRAFATVEGIGLHALSLTDLSAPAELSPDDLCTLAELAASQQLYEGDLAGLGADDGSRCGAFRQRHRTTGSRVDRLPEPPAEALATNSDSSPTGTPGVGSGNGPPTPSARRSRFARTTTGSATASPPSSPRPAKLMPTADTAGRCSNASAIPRTLPSPR